jgi:peptidoglycan/LPS O-acetylase OafA/YrhL
MDFTIIIPAVALLTLWLILDVVTNPDGRLSEGTIVSAARIYVGSISYGIYLWHWPLLKIAEDGSNNLLAKLIIGACCSSALAAFSHHYIEQPFRRLKRRLAPHSRTAIVGA